MTTTNGSLHPETFLVDLGADRTVFSAFLLAKLGVQGNHADPGYQLQGIGGASSFVQVAAVLELPRNDGGPVRISGPYCAFTDPAATSISILGRDVLHHFDVIVSRRRHEVLLLAGNHQYHVTAT